MVTKAGITPSRNPTTHSANPNPAARLRRVATLINRQIEAFAKWGTALHLQLVRFQPTASQTKIDSFPTSFKK